LTSLGTVLELAVGTLRFLYLDITVLYHLDVRAVFYHLNL